MRVLNVHQRALPITPQQAAILIDSLASDHDELWPKEQWPPMKLELPLKVGSAGGHGPIAYVVERYEPGRRIAFRFTAPRGFHGQHELELEARGEDGATLRHTLRMRTHGLAILSWPIVYRPLHDALIEDALSRAEAFAGHPAPSPTWSRWVRVLRWILSRRAGRAAAK